MNKLYLIDENTRLSKGKINEGGYSRNYALMNWLKNNYCDLQIIELKNNKLFRYSKVLWLLLTKKGKTIIFQYPTIGIPLFSSNIFKRIIFNAFIYLLSRPKPNSSVIFDVSDLKFEQSIDLKVNEHLNNIENDEKKLLSAKNVFLIFASENMRNFACQKYDIPYINTDVCINGGTLLEKTDVDISIIDKSKINYVYAGTLNKGRQIEQMLNSFPESSGMHLFLMGTNGEWISSKNKNITYLGSFDDKDAHFFASKCDVGLIPYDENRLYYNIAYPTKLSFYITANIPYISTPVSEVIAVNNNLDGGWLAPISDWNSLFSGLTKLDIMEKKKKVEKKASRFLWDYIFDRNKFIKKD